MEFYEQYIGKVLHTPWKTRMYFGPKPVGKYLELKTINYMDHSLTFISLDTGQAFKIDAQYLRGYSLELVKGYNTKLWKTLNSK